ncbi:hypothetical protein AK812_SmicGene46336, partial [Symbiodinium microadriaticum]
QPVRESNAHRGHGAVCPNAHEVCALHEDRRRLVVFSSGAQGACE